MNILITGLGALGTVHGCLLKKAGHRVHGLVKERHLAGLQDRKLQVSGIWGRHEAVLDSIHGSIDGLRSMPLDLIILTVKSFDTSDAVRQVAPLVGKDTLVLAAQNGYGNYETVSAAIGREHTLLARVIFGVKLHSPGHAEVTVIADAVRIGQPDHAVPMERVQAVAAALDAAGIPAAAAEDITAILWDKILYNSALNPLGAILECTYGRLAENPESRRLMNAIIDEIFQVARAQGVPLRWSSATEYQRHFYEKLVPPTAKHYPSMYHDVQAGKRVEIDALNGAVVRLAREKGIEAPVNETVTRLMLAKEALRREGRQ